MASKSTLPEESNQSELRKLPPVVVVVRKELHTLIGTVKEMGPVTTYQEVLDGLGKYILKKKLFDENNPYKVRCKDDELGSILGIEEFTMYNLNDLKPFLQKMAIPVTKTCVNSVIKETPVIKPAEAVALYSDNPLKRKLDESSEYDKKKCAVDVKGFPSSPLVIHIPPSPNYIDESDSVESIQGYETAVVKDTSDDFLSADNEEQILAVEETYNIEYEVESDSSIDPTLDDKSSDSEGEEHPETMMLLNATIFTLLSKRESDIEFFADDSSDNDSEDDAEITESDFWTCKTCKVANKPPMRYCLRCFNERLNWLPDNERKRKPKKSARTSDKDSNEASSSKNDLCSSQGSNSPAVSWVVKSPPSSELGSANVSYVDSPSIESVSSPYTMPADLACTESSDLPSTEYTPDMDTKGLPPNNYLGSSCDEYLSPHYFRPVGPYILEPTDPYSMDSGLCSLEPKSSFCMKSIGTFFEGLKSLPPIESLGSSSVESSSPSSLESVYPSSMRSSDSSSAELACSSSVNPSGCSKKESACPSSTKSSGASNADPDAKLCRICFINPANASIIHGKYAHQITCYECAKKLKKGTGVCPVCRKPIERVVHQINL